MFKFPDKRLQWLIGIIIAIISGIIIPIAIQHFDGKSNVNYSNSKYNIKKSNLIVKGIGYTKDNNSPLKIREDKAKKAAVMDAKRKLLKKMEGYNIISNEAFNDGYIENDRITAEAKGFIKEGNFIEHSYTYDNSIGRAEVEMEFFNSGEN